MSDVDLRGKVAVITGASLGIGRATAVAFAKAGAKVVVNYRSSAKQAEDVVKTIEQAGGIALAYQADVADFDAVQGMIDETARQFGRLDIAVSNAAYSDREPFYQADLGGFKRTVDVTMWGAFHLLHAATRQMMAQAAAGQPAGGSIVIVSSPHAYVAIPRSMAYNMAKA